MLTQLFVSYSPVSAISLACCLLSSETFLQVAQILVKTRHEDPFCMQTQSMEGGRGLTTMGESSTENNDEGKNSVDAIGNVYCCKILPFENF
ncbi:hypothetical protein E2C01_093964 [Portunus trituberculatus]|uniref:Uncharacterized protein n=1 Tax=Portunus trituberculatus TaxID=210409 RepID=A0A5B7JP62_PORTR|nr:hypothetical protein [Portunus trituberculatus]